MLQHGMTPRMPVTSPQTPSAFLFVDGVARAGRTPRVARAPYWRVLPVLRRCPYGCRTRLAVLRRLAVLGAARTAAGRTGGCAVLRLAVLRRAVRDRRGGVAVRTGGGSVGGVPAGRRTGLRAAGSAGPTGPAAARARPCRVVGFCGSSGVDIVPPGSRRCRAAVDAGGVANAHGLPPTTECYVRHRRRNDPCRTEVSPARHDARGGGSVAAVARLAGTSLGAALAVAGRRRAAGRRSGSRR